MAGTRELQKLFSQVSSAVHDKRDYLCELDSAAGDGDHGISIDLGWSAINNLTVDENANCSDYLKQCAKVFISAVGASIGPLYGTALLRASAKVQGKTTITLEDCAAMYDAAVNGIMERGNAKIGDKTLLDTLIPCRDTLIEKLNCGSSVEDAINAAVLAAETGMLSTKDMVAKIGRSSRLGDRSIGSIDPGAASAYIIVDTVKNFIFNETNVKSAN
jgi:dihydroxyacetone kinase-like protein